MIVRILGSGSGMPEPGRSHSALWCNIDEQQILFDCGEGTAQKLIEYELDGNFLDAIIISHFHPDHVSGIFMVLQMLHLQQREKSLDVYLPEMTDVFESMLRMFYLFPGKLTFKLNLLDISDLKENISSIEPVMNNHLSNYHELIRKSGFCNTGHAYSFFIRRERENLLFTFDIDNTELLKNYIADAGIVIIDALHPPVENILSIMENQEKRIILVHGISNELKEAISTRSAGNVIRAEDGYQIEI